MFERLRPARIVGVVPCAKGSVLRILMRKKPSASGAYLKMVIDCRPANKTFRGPPNIVFSSLESLARMDLNEEDTPCTSTVDVRDRFCFYRIRIPQEFAESVALLPIDAS